MTTYARSRREAEEVQIAAYIEAGKMRKLPPVADPVARFAELRRELEANVVNSTFRKPRGRPRKTATVSMIFAIALSVGSSAYAGSRNNSHDANPANKSALDYTADRAGWDAVLAERDRARATHAAAIKANKDEADWEAAVTFCRALPDTAGDSRTPVCQQICERAAAIDKANDAAQKAAATNILKHALAVAPNPRR